MSFEMPEGGANGVLLANGGSSGGYSLYVLDGKPVYEMNFFGAARYRVEADEALPSGKVELVMSYTQEGKAPLGGQATLRVNGKEVARGPIEKVPPFRYSATETLDVGMDLGAVVSPRYHDQAPFAFTGTIHEVRVDLR